MNCSACLALVTARMVSVPFTVYYALCSYCIHPSDALSVFLAAKVMAANTPICSAFVVQQRWIRGRTLVEQRCGCIGISSAQCVTTIHLICWNINSSARGGLGYGSFGKCGDSQSCGSFGNLFSVEADVILRKLMRGEVVAVEAAVVKQWQQWLQPRIFWRLDLPLCLFNTCQQILLHGRMLWWWKWGSCSAAAETASARIWWPWYKRR